MHNDTPSAARNKKGLSALGAAGIGVGGIIGAGFFLGSSLAIRQAGPSVVLAYLLGGLIMSQVLSAMMSISMNRPVEGSFRAHVEQMLGRFAGYMLGWSVCVSGVLAISSEAIAAGVFARYWLPAVPVPLLALPALLAAAAINTLNVRYFSLAESGMAFFKIAILALFIFAGGASLLTGAGARPGPGAWFPNGLTGLMQSMLIVIFTYAGISAVAMAAPRVRDPKRGIARANVLVVAGVILLYVPSVYIAVSAIGWREVNAEISPFVQAIGAVGLGRAAALFNAAILIATLSVMTASYFNNMRVAASLSRSHMAPPALERRSGGRGFLKNAWLLTGAACLLAAAFSFAVGAKLFNYLVSASSYVTFMNWIVNMSAYLRWLKRRGPDETASSPLAPGRPGAFAAIAAILVLAGYSLTVPDFRIGFAIFLCIELLFGAVYLLTGNGKKA